MEESITFPSGYTHGFFRVMHSHSFVDFDRFEMDRTRRWGKENTRVGRKPICNRSR